MQIYNWESNELSVEDKYGNRYNLIFRGNKTIVKGESGTGKTHLVNIIKDIKESYNEEYYDTKNIFILTRENKTEILNIERKLIIIDSADLVLDDESIKFINRDTQNRYLIFTRVPMGFELSPNHKADFETVGKTTSIKYRFSVRGWC